MSVGGRGVLFALLFALFFVGVLFVAVLPVRAENTLVWQGDVSSSGVPTDSPVLGNGVQYVIVASEVWWYNNPSNLAADAQYYTTDPSNSWFWGNHFSAPGGHSFLQINGTDVNWGPFTTGETMHSYTISYVGKGQALAFQIVDWVDSNYSNNFCHIVVKIYTEMVVGGEVVNPDLAGKIGLWAIGVSVLAALAMVSVKFRRTS
jgi:hypothetical protein